MKTLLIFAAMILAATSAMASGACTQESLNNYLVPGFSCSIDNLMFSNFGYSGAGSPVGNAIPAGGIDVTPLTTALDVGLQFNPGMSVGTQPGGASAFQDSLITFTVSTVNGAATLEDLGLFFQGSFTGTGTSSVTENYCLGGSLLGCPGANAGQLKVTNPPPVFNDATSFAGVTSISVSKDINVTSGTAGTANTSMVVNTFSQFSQVPEPMSMVMLGAGLMGIGLLRKRAVRS
jgi:hypothetical protein